MGERFTKFNSNYLMRSRHQRTDLGTVMERDWVTTNGINVLRFGAGRRIWYNSGSFVFTTSNIPTYHKRHKLTLEEKEWSWDDCKSADGTVNAVEPSYKTKDIRDFAYYGSCVELIRATIDEIILDFPGRLKCGNEILRSKFSCGDCSPASAADCLNSPTKQEEIRNINPFIENVILDDEVILGKLIRNDFNIDMHHSSVDLDEYDNELRFMCRSWQKYATKENGDEELDIKEYKIEPICDNLSKCETENYGKILHEISIKSDNGDEKNDIPVTKEKTYTVYSIITENGIKYSYNEDTSFGDYIGCRLEKEDILISDLDKAKGEYEEKMAEAKSAYDNSMTEAETSYNESIAEAETSYNESIADVESKYNNGLITDEEYEQLKSEALEEFEQTKSDAFTEREQKENEAYNKRVEDEKKAYNERVEDENEAYYAKYHTAIVECDNDFLEIVTNGYVNFEIKPQQEVIDEYFASLKGFKGRLLCQDTKPLYQNIFITPKEHNFKWYYIDKAYIWPSDGYCIDISSMAFSNFYQNLIGMGELYDELWSDNLYRSMTHEAIKNFDWTYTREYVDGEEQDNIDGGERMKKIIRLFGRVFDDVKYYIDTIKNTTNITYDKNRNCPEALLSDNVNFKGVDLITTIGVDYDLDATIDKEFLDSEKDFVQKDEIREGEESKHKKWYQTKDSNDIYPDVCDNEFMRRFSLSSKRIMQSKGTQQSIEMIMALFGFGRYQDYDIQEEAYYVDTLIKSDDCTKDSGISTPSGFGSVRNGDLAAEINASKDMSLLYYEDPMSGVPMRNTVLFTSGKSFRKMVKDDEGIWNWEELTDDTDLKREDDNFLVPYYDSSVLYDGNLVFQSKGGWGKMVHKEDNDETDNCFDYQETLSYLHVVGTVGDLFSINPNAIEKNEIYYVVNLNTYTQFDEFASQYTSHYFVVSDPSYIGSLAGWNNVLLTVDEEKKIRPLTKEEFESEKTNAAIRNEWAYDVSGVDENATDEEKMSVYTNCYKRVMYLENLFSTNIGNNPHVGYGNYDDGNEFLEYMKQPFKYSIDTSKFNSIDVEDAARKYNFELKELKPETDDDDSKRQLKLRVLNPKDESTNWFINTKVLTIENKVFGEGDELTKEYTNYFKTVIMPYVMQVIPSTTILKLKNFD